MAFSLATDQRDTLFNCQKKIGILVFFLQLVLLFWLLGTCRGSAFPCSALRRKCPCCVRPRRPLIFLHRPLSTCVVRVCGGNVRPAVLTLGTGPPVSRVCVALLSRLPCVEKGQASGRSAGSVPLMGVVGSFVSFPQLSATVIK